MTLIVLDCVPGRKAVEAGGVVVLKMLPVGERIGVNVKNLTAMIVVQTVIAGT